MTQMMILTMKILMIHLMWTQIVQMWIMLIKVFDITWLMSFTHSNLYTYRFFAFPGYIDIGDPHYICQYCGTNMWYEKNKNKNKKHLAQSFISIMGLERYNFQKNIKQIYYDFHFLQIILVIQYTYMRSKKYIYIYIYIISMNI